MQASSAGVTHRSSGPNTGSPSEGGQILKKIIINYLRASLAAKAHAAMTKRMLKTAEPTMVPEKN